VVNWIDPNDHTAGCFCAPRQLLDLLEAGKPVILRPAAVSLALWLRDRPRRRVRLPFDRSVRFVQVSTDDRIVPVADLKWGGVAAQVD
jgi:hypothetical protein